MGLDSANFMFMVFSIMLLFFVDYMKRKDILIRKEIIEMNVYARIFIVSFSIVFILVFGIWGPGYDVKDFIYFQF